MMEVFNRPTPISTGVFVYMRKLFAEILHDRMLQNRDIWVLTADLGYKMWDNIRRDYPDRFINVGASEQAMIGIAVGLAQEGKIPFCYSITPFLLYRPFEAIRNYLDHEQIGVKLIGSGRGREYIHDGFSHWAEEEFPFDNIDAYWADDKIMLAPLIDKMIMFPKPYYLNLKRSL